MDTSINSILNPQPKPQIQPDNSPNQSKPAAKNLSAKFHGNLLPGNVVHEGDDTVKLAMLENQGFQGHLLDPDHENAIMNQAIVLDNGSEPEQESFQPPADPGEGKMKKVLKIAIKVTLGIVTLGLHTLLDRKINKITRQQNTDRTVSDIAVAVEKSANQSVEGSLTTRGANTIDTIDMLGETSENHFVQDKSENIDPIDYVEGVNDSGQTSQIETTAPNTIKAFEFYEEGVSTIDVGEGDEGTIDETISADLPQNIEPEGDEETWVDDQRKYDELLQKSKAEFKNMISKNVFEDEQLMSNIIEEIDSAA